jgi:hypothetical protein
VTLGRTPVQLDLWRSTASFCEYRVDPDSIYGVLQRECFNLFPDEMFADLFTDVRSRSVPPMIVVVLLVLPVVAVVMDQSFGCGWAGPRAGGPVVFEGRREGLVTAGHANRGRRPSARARKAQSGTGCTDRPGKPRVPRQESAWALSVWLGESAGA